MNWTREVGRRDKRNRQRVHEIYFLFRWLFWKRIVGLYKVFELIQSIYSLNSSRSVWKGCTILHAISVQSGLLLIAVHSYHLSKPTQSLISFGEYRCWNSRMSSWEIRYFSFAWWRMHFWGEWKFCWHKRCVLLGTSTTLQCLPRILRHIAIWWLLISRPLHSKDSSVLLEWTRNSISGMQDMKQHCESLDNHSRQKAASLQFDVQIFYWNKHPGS